MPVMKWRKTAMLFKLESTYGTDPTPSGAANAVKVQNATYSPMEGQDLQMDYLLPYISADPSKPADLHSTLQFEVALVGSGAAGTAPAFGPILRALGLAETIVTDTSVTYNPVSDNHDSATVYFNKDGIRYKGVGGRGTGTLTLNASGLPILQVNMTFLYVQPADATLPTTDYSAWNEPVVVSDANSAFTINGDPAVMRSFTFNLGNTVEPIFEVGDEQIAIVDRAETFDLQIRAGALSDFNPYALAEAGTTVPMVFTHEKATAGRIITLTQPRVQLMRPGAPTEAQGLVEWPLTAKPLPGSGNDQFTLAFT